MKTPAEKILVLDYGSQYTQLIARALRELGAYCEIRPHDLPDADIAAFAPRGIVLSGGPESALGPDAPQLSDAVVDAGVPTLGVCYGMQALAAKLGGELQASARREYGPAVIRRERESVLLDAAFGDGDALPVWMSHGDAIVKAPPGFVSLATGGNGEKVDGGGGGGQISGKIVAMADESRKLFGLQFHPEVSHTRNGREILARFVRDICGMRCEWTAPNFIDAAVGDIREKVGNDKVLLALSGGVDSAVAAALLHRAIGGALTCVLVDNGLMRMGEVSQVREVFAERFGMELVVVDAADKFFASLKGVTDPEEKRRRIGRAFIEVFECEATTSGAGAKWLAQGTIYPDVVESAKAASGKAAAIKTHHNVGGLPERLRLRLIEPLRELFKDEVRRAGSALGLPEGLLNRHPFPGPGLAVRVLGEATPERVEIARRADAIFMEELRASGTHSSAAQAFAVLLPVKSVGVMGDFRTYENVVALRAVTTDDFMTADWTRLPDDVLSRSSSRIVNEVSGVNRVVYDITSKPPGTVEWE